MKKPTHKKMRSVDGLKYKIFKLKQEKEELKQALLKSINIIKTWHNMGMNEPQAKECWNIYFNNAPEMKIIREALENE